MTCGPSCCARCRAPFVGAAPLPEPLAVEGEGAFTRKVDRAKQFAHADLRPIAIHEAGHAVVAMLLGWAIGLRGVDIAQRFSANIARPPGATYEHERVTVLVAGHAAGRWATASHLAPRVRIPSVLSRRGASRRGPDLRQLPLLRGAGPGEA